MIFYNLIIKHLCSDGEYITDIEAPFKYKENAERYLERWLKDQEFPQCYLHYIQETSFCDEYDLDLLKKEAKEHGVEI